MDVAETIKKVANFAEKGQGALQSAWGLVLFRGHQVSAQTPQGGMCATVPDLDLKADVPADPLVKALKALSGAPQFEIKDKFTLALSSGTTRIEVPLSQAGTVPKAYQPPKKAKWYSTDIFSQIKRVSWCCSTDTSRSALTGLWLTTQGLEAANGHAMVRLRDETDFVKLLGRPAMIAPALLKDIGPEASFCSEDRRIFIAEDAEKMVYRSVVMADVEMPPLDRVLTEAVQQPSVRVSREGLLDVVKRAAISQPEMIFEVAGPSLTVSVRQGSGTVFGFRAELGLSENDGVPDGKIGLDARYLKPMLEGAISDEVTLRLTPTPEGALTGVVLEDEAYMGMIMPWRL